MGNTTSALTKLKSSVSRTQATDLVGPAPPQQVILDPNVDSIVQSLNNQASFDREQEREETVRAAHVSLGKIKPIDAVIAVVKSSITMDQIAGDRFLISFEYSSTGPVTVSISFHQILKSIGNGIPKFSKPGIQLPPRDLPVGSKLRYLMEPGSMGRQMTLPTVTSCLFRTDRTFVPILIVLTSKNTDYTMYIMAGIAKDDSTGRCNLIVTKQRVKQGSSGYQIQEIYGLKNSSVTKDYSKEIEGANKDTEDSQSSCVICLTNSKDTFVMPCRHMCLCFTCASSMASQQQKCPICRSTISHIITVSKEDTT